MPSKQTFLVAEWSEQWKSSYAELSADRQAACDKAVITLIKQISSPGLRIKPIHPDKHYSEARINSGDRIIFRIESGTIFFVDVVKHDEISRYGRKSSKRK
jgi:mRNA-degrading endonuclease RelE of RelBE toxin-antitoxin system